MTLDEYIEQERGIRNGVHKHDGVWWKGTSIGCCHLLCPIQEVVPGQSRPSFAKSFLRYYHRVPAGCPRSRSITRYMLQGDRFLNYGLNTLSSKRRQLIRRANRLGYQVGKIDSLEDHRLELQKIYVSTAQRNRHGLAEDWYISNQSTWWRNLQQEYALPGRDWFGVFLAGQLVSFMYCVHVEDTVMWLVNKCNEEFLKSDPNDLLWFEVIDYYKKIDTCEKIDAGQAVPIPPSIDWRKAHLGFEAIDVPIFEKVNVGALGTARVAVGALAPFTRSNDPSNRGFAFRVRNLEKLLKEVGQRKMH